MRNGYIFLVLLMAISSNAQAGVKYRIFTCKNEADATSCSKSCRERDSNLLHEYIVNENTGVVMRSVFFYGNRTSTDALKDCSVADKQNWICGGERPSEYEKQNKEYGWSIFETSSVDGQIKNVYESFTRKKYSGKGVDTMIVDYTCSKIIK